MVETGLYWVIVWIIDFLAEVNGGVDVGRCIESNTNEFHCFHALLGREIGKLIAHDIKLPIEFLKRNQNLIHSTLFPFSGRFIFENRIHL